MTKLKQAVNPLDRVDQLLMSIRSTKEMLARTTIMANEEIDQIKQKYASQMDEWNRAVTTLEKELGRLVLAENETIMAGSDRADFTHGSVMLKTEQRVKQIKGMLEKLKAAGIHEAVKVAKEVVDWDMVEKLPDTTLAALGTERIAKIHFNYELAGHDG